MNSFSATKVWLLFAMVASSAVGYACSANDATVLDKNGLTKDGAAEDGGVADDGGAVGENDGGDDVQDGGSAFLKDASSLDGGGAEACGKCPDPTAVCAYRIQDACSAVGECMVPTFNECLPNWVKIGCDCSGKTMFSGSGCETAGLPEGYARWPMSERFEDPASATPCPNDSDSDAGG